MALFQDTRELERQERYVGMTQPQGFRKGAMSLLGYNPDGTKKKGSFETIGGRFLARQFAKGTDTEDVFKETQDEFVAKKLGQAKFAFEAGKLALTLGKGDALKGLGLGKKAADGTPSLATTPINGDIATSTAGTNLTKVLDEQAQRTAIDATSSNVDNIVGNMTDSNLVKSVGLEDRDFIIDDAGRKIYKDELGEEIDMTPEAMKLKKQQAMQEKLGKAANLLDTVPIFGKAASAGLEALALSKAQRAEANRVAMDFKRRTAKDPQYNLL